MGLHNEGRTKVAAQSPLYWGSGGGGGSGIWKCTQLTTLVMSIGGGVPTALVAGNLLPAAPEWCNFRGEHPFQRLQNGARPFNRPCHPLTRPAHCITCGPACAGAPGRHQNECWTRGALGHRSWHTRNRVPFAIPPQRWNAPRPLGASPGGYVIMKWWTVSGVRGRARGIGRPAAPMKNWTHAVRKKKAF